MSDKLKTFAIKAKQIYNEEESKKTRAIFIDEPLFQRNGGFYTRSELKPKEKTKRIEKNSNLTENLTTNSGTTWVCLDKQVKKQKILNYLIINGTDFITLENISKYNFRDILFDEGVVKSLEFFEKD